MATPMKNLIGGFLKKKQEKIHLREVVVGIVGKHLSNELKKHVVLKNIRGDELLFYSDSSSATYEFSLHKNSLLAEVQKEFPQIKKTRIKTGCL